MLNKNFAIAFVVMLALVCFAEAREENPHDMADALRMLQELDRYYTQASRPRVANAIQCCVDQCKSYVTHGTYCSCELCWSPLSIRVDRRDVADEDRVDPQLLDRALRLLQLQNLDRIYSYHTRPRFGKRSDAISNWAKDLEKPDLPAWLAYARRR